jgi:hypothetical protein
MADPTAYTPSYSFTGWQSANPSLPLPAVQVDGQLEDISQSTEELRDAIKDVRRADGNLNNRLVTVASLADETVSYIAARTRDGAAVSYQLVTTTGYQIVDNTRLLADLSGGAMSWTMPASPVDGTGVSIQVDDNAYTHNLTLVRNGATFNGLAEDLIVDIANARLDLVYINGTWRY